MLNNALSWLVKLIEGLEKRMKKLLLLVTLILFASSPCIAQAWQVGDKAYVYNYYNDTQNKKEFVLVEIDDIRGSRAKIIAKAACNDNGWAGKGCNTGWFPGGRGGDILQLGDSRWADFSELLTSWEDKVR
jgi:hypothetical protein